MMSHQINELRAQIDGRFKAMLDDMGLNAAQKIYILDLQKIIIAERLLTQQVITTLSQQVNEGIKTVQEVSTP